MSEEVILVDDDDNFLGTADKLEAHRQGLLHRAFSVFIINDTGEWLLQQRAMEKYHSGGLWTNACCSHPRPDETTMEAAVRRLHEEMGITAALTHLFHFTYRTEFDNGLIEHELDHVYIGRFSGTPQPDPNEVMDWKFVHPEKIIAEVKAYPERFTEWFKLSYEIVLINAFID